MEGIIEVSIPDSCMECDNFKCILENTITINYADKRIEEVSGACKCNLDDRHRLIPMDNGQIMELVSKRTEQGLVTQTKIHKGRPNWCRIKAVVNREVDE